MLNLGLESLNEYDGFSSMSEEQLYQLECENYKNEIQLISQQNELTTIITALQNYYIVADHISKYGITPALEDLVGRDIIASLEAEQASGNKQNWFQKAWRKIKEFFVNMWRWITGKAQQDRQQLARTKENAKHLQDRIDKIGSENSSNKMKIEQFSAKVSELQKQNIDLKQFKAKFEEAEQQNSKLKSENSKLKSENDELEKDKEYLKKDRNWYKAGMADMENKLENVTNTLLRCCIIKLVLYKKSPKQVGLEDRILNVREYLRERNALPWFKGSTQVKRIIEYVKKIADDIFKQYTITSRDRQLAKDARLSKTPPKKYNEHDSALFKVWDEAFAEGEQVSNALKRQMSDQFKPVTVYVALNPKKIKQQIDMLTTHFVREVGNLEEQAHNLKDLFDEIDRKSSMSKNETLKMPPQWAKLTHRLLRQVQHERQLVSICISNLYKQTKH